MSRSAHFQRLWVVVFAKKRWTSQKRAMGPIIFLSGAVSNFKLKSRTELTILPLASLWYAFGLAPRLVKHHRRQYLQMECVNLDGRSSSRTESLNCWQFGMAVYSLQPSGQSFHYQVVSGVNNREVAHQASAAVCWLWLYITFPFETHSKASVIDKFLDPIFLKASQAVWTFLVSSAAATASFPQEIFACLVDLASPVSR